MVNRKETMNPVLFDRPRVAPSVDRARFPSVGDHDSVPVLCFIPSVYESLVKPDETLYESLLMSGMELKQPSEAMKGSRYPIGVVVIRDTYLRDSESARTFTKTFHIGSAATALQFAIHDMVRGALSICEYAVAIVLRDEWSPISVNQEVLRFNLAHMKYDSIQDFEERGNNYHTIGSLLEYVFQAFYRFRARELIDTRLLMKTPNLFKRRRTERYYLVTNGYSNLYEQVLDQFKDLISAMGIELVDFNSEGEVLSGAIYIAFRREVDEAEVNTLIGFA